MNDVQEAAQGSAATAKERLTFGRMSLLQKCRFVLKVSICLLSFGFLYPHVLSE